MINKKLGDGIEIIFPYNAINSSLNSNFHNKDKYQIVFFGCHGKGSEKHTDVIKNYLNNHQITPDFFLLNGDNFYDSGVENTESPLFKTCFETPYAKHFTSQFFFPILGNHDYGEFFLGGLKNLLLFRKNRSSPQAQVQYSTKSKNWYMPGFYYSIKDSNHIFELFCIDSNTILFHEKQQEWLKNKVTNSKAKWKILVSHHPLVTNGHHASEPDVIGLHNFINENFQKNSNPNLNFNLFIAAHEHNNQVLIDSVHSYQIIVGNCSSKKPAHVNKKQNTLYCSAEPNDFSFGLLTLSKDNIICDIKGNKSNYNFDYDKIKNLQKNVSPIKFNQPDIIKNSSIINTSIYLNPDLSLSLDERKIYLQYLYDEIEMSSLHWNQYSYLGIFARRYDELKKIDQLLVNAKLYVKNFNQIKESNIPWLELWTVVENLYVYISDMHYYCLKINEDHEKKNKKSKRQEALQNLENRIYGIYNIFYYILIHFYRSKNSPENLIHEQALSDLYKFEAYCNRCRIEKGYRTIKKLKYYIGHKKR